jgi:hypothetical protein
MGLLETFALSNPATEKELSRSAQPAPLDTDVDTGAPIRNRNGLPTSSINIMVFEVPSVIWLILTPETLFEEKLRSTPL